MICTLLLLFISNWTDIFPFPPHHPSPLFFKVSSVCLLYPVFSVPSFFICFSLCSYFTFFFVLFMVYFILLFIRLTSLEGLCRSGCSKATRRTKATYRHERPSPPPCLFTEACMSAQIIPCRSFLNQETSLS